jgi:two-component system chemotaxis response regulator CheB
VLPCHLAKDAQPIVKGNIYIAPPNYHLLVKKNIIGIADGPEENRWRPSIDVLFRSAAAAYGEAVIGVVLTGLLDDGTSGMLAINKCGGTTIVQDPNEAEYPDMPLSVLNNMEVNYCLPLSQMGFVIFDSIKHKELTGIPIPEEIIAESAIAERTATGIDIIRPLADPSVYTCPDCGGGLWEIKQKGFHRYRCNIGHAYSENDLVKKQTEELEATLWIALRMMEERNSLLKKIGRQELSKGLAQLASGHFKKATELEKHIANLKELIFNNKKSN